MEVEGNSEANEAGGSIHKYDNVWIASTSSLKGGRFAGFFESLLKLKNYDVLSRQGPGEYSLLFYHLVV